MTKRALYRDIVKGTGAYSISTFVPRAISFLLFPLYTRYLTTADYGVMELLDLTGFLFTALIWMGSTDALFFYYWKAGTEQDRHATVFTMLSGAGLLGAAGSVLGWWAAPSISQWVFQSAEYGRQFRVVLLSCSISLPYEVCLGYLRVTNRATTYVYASLARLVVSVAVTVVLLVQYDWGIWAVLFGTLAANGIMALTLGVYTLGKVWMQGSFQLALLKKFARYATPLGASGLAMLLVHYGDRYILQRNVTLAEIGVYSLAYRLGMVITHLYTPFYTYWRSQMVSIVASPHGEAIYVRVCTYLTVLLTFVVLLFALFIRPVLHVLVTEPFWPAAQYVPWIAAAYGIRSVATQSRGVFLLEGKTGGEFGITLAGALVCLLAYVMLIPPLKVWGAVVSTLLAFAVMFVLGLWQAQKVRRFPFEFRRMLSAVSWAVLLGAAFYWVQPEDLGLQILLALLVALLYPLALGLSGFLAPEEKLAAKELGGRVLAAAGLGPRKQ